MRKVTTESNGSNQETQTAKVPTGPKRMGLYSSLLYAHWQEVGALYDLDTQEMGARLLSAFTETEITAPNTFDPVKALIDIWGSALMPGELTVNAYGLLNSLLNEVRAGSTVVQAGERGRKLIKFALTPLE